MATVTATYSRNMNQPGFVDLNVTPAARFTLPGEDGRPVFVDAGEHRAEHRRDRAARRTRTTDQFNRVTELRSNLTSTSRQLTITLSPAVGELAVHVGAELHAQQRARQRERFHEHCRAIRSTSRAAARRPIGGIRCIVNVGANVFDVVRVNWNQRFLSGMPFTPMVASDVNGDGYANDRAFILDPAHATGADASLASGMAALLAARRRSACAAVSTSSSAQLAARNSCEGPWTSTAFMTVALNPVRIRLPQRATLSFAIGNPLGAADYLLHGESHTHGGDRRRSPIRGCCSCAASTRRRCRTRTRSISDSATRARRRARFGTPVTITASLRVDVGPPRERQALTQTLDRGRTSGGAKVTEAMLRLAYGSGGIINPMDGDPPRRR